VFAADQTVPELTLPALNPRVIARRLAVPALGAGVAVAAVCFAGGPVHRLAGVLRHGLGTHSGWVAVGAALECLSLAGYVALLSLVAGRASARLGARESAQVTLAGAAATRLLPTAGAGGAALALWTFRRAGLKPAAAARTLLVFLVLLYTVFLAAIVLAGAALGLGLVPGRGPSLLGAGAAALATLCIGVAVLLGVLTARERDGAGCASRMRRGGRLLGDAVRGAWTLVRARNLRLAGAVLYWGFDAAVLWAMLHAFGAPPALPVVALAYFVGQVANTLPLPGSVSGGIAGVLIAFGLPAEVALPSTLAYRTIAVWLPTPVALAAVPALRSTVARWGREDAAAATS
jgi:uncharacterized membrane protein YbhN (UPF0104 family)